MSSPIQRKYARYEMRRASTIAIGAAIQENIKGLGLMPYLRWYHLAERMCECGRNQKIAIHTPDHGPTEFTVRNKRACKIRICPQCMYRKACADRANLVAIIDEVWRKHQTARPVLLTLTTRNRPLHEAKAMLRDHRAALKRFWKSPTVIRHTLGSFTAIEMDIRGANKAPEAGIHSHSIAMVPAGYFANDIPALWNKDYQDLWKRSARLNYAPIVDVRAIGSHDGPEQHESMYGAVVECAKYCISTDTLFDHTPNGIRVDGHTARLILDVFKGQHLHSFDRCFADARKRVRAASKTGHAR
jgi:plasmid rolling circle replication initiator protein Rep